MAEVPSKAQANRRERSWLLMSFAMLSLAVGMALAVTKGIPYVDYSISWQMRFSIFAGPALLLFLMSGFLQISELKVILRMIPKIKFEAREPKDGTGDV